MKTIILSLSMFLLFQTLFAADDQEYGRLIREYTTSSEFLTDLVDHLPASANVPTPQKFLGYAAGTPDRLTYASDVHRYMRALESASPRVRVFSIGKSEEGREMIVVAIADEETMQKLDFYKEINRKLSDPRKLTPEEAAALIKQGKPIYYATGAMHSPETGSPEMLMELAYRLAVSDRTEIQSIRKNIITLITPVLEVDGRERMVDLVRWYQKNKDAGLPPFVYWGKYAAHDNNRDTMGLGLNLTRNVLKTYYEWHPQIIHDLHESIPFLYISTGTGPYNAWLDPIAIDEWHRMAYNEVQTLTAKGLPGVWTHGFYDGWAPGYMFWIGHGHNSIGRFYETFGNAVPSTEERIIRGSSERSWYRQNPPYPKVKWSLRNNINYQQSGLILGLKYVADNREHFLKLFWDIGKRSIAKATKEGPAAYAFPADQKRKGQLRDLFLLLEQHGIEIHQTESAYSTKQTWPPKRKEDPKKDKPKKEEKKEEEKELEIKLATGSYVIRLDQPYSRLADALLDIQYVRGDEQVYDDAGWTLGYVKNVDVHRIVNPEILKVPMHRWKQNTAPAKLNGKNILVKNNADTDLIRLRYANPDLKMFYLDEPWKQKAAEWPAGTIAVAAGDSNDKAFSGLDLDVTVIPELPKVKLREVPVPRVAILHTWLDTQDEGWFRLAFDSLNVPYDYISTQDVAAIPDLKSRYEVILFPPAEATPQEIMNGLPAGPPLPWKKSELTPNLGVDETDDMRPGLGIAGLANIKKFVEQGGLLITCRNTSQWAIEYGLARWIKIIPAQKLKSRGSILQAVTTDPRSPVAYGYDDKVPVHFSGSPIFRVGVLDPPSAEDQRPSGRGSKSDPDVPQGRPFIETPERPKYEPWEEGFQLPENQSWWYKPYFPKPEERPRVIFSFPKEADKILLSGMLEGADEIAGKPVIIDSRLGKGHILLFANNPMWRQNTQGNFALIFNAILHFDRLDKEWPQPTK